MTPDARCQVCGEMGSAANQYDLKGDVPGGMKVTCPTCGFKLYEAEIARLKALNESLAERIDSEQELRTKRMQADV
jgi:hypothetical protein